MEITLAFSIVDAIFGEKDTTDMTSCNGWNIDYGKTTNKERR